MPTNLIESASDRLASHSNNRRDALARPVARAARTVSITVMALLLLTGLSVTGCDETDGLIAIGGFGSSGFVDDFGSSGGFSNDSSGECEFFSSGTICPGGLVSFNLDPVFKSKHASTRAESVSKAAHR